MPGPIWVDDVKDTSSTTGTGTLTLANSPPTGSVAVSTIGDGNWSYFKAYSADLSQYEIFQGTFTLSGQLLSRTTVIQSSNSNNLVNFSLALTIELVAPSVFFSYGAGANPGAVALAIIGGM